MSERKYIVTHDLDGVQVAAPPPLQTILKLFIGNLDLDKSSSKKKEIEQRNGLIAAFATSWHTLRWSSAYSRQALELYYQVAQEFNVSLEMAALSGRERFMLQPTRFQLGDKMDYLSDLYLNPGLNSAAWKEAKVTDFVDQGYFVIHEEDDLSAALRVARVDSSQVRVHLHKPWLYPKWLLNRAGVVVPNNVVPIRDFRESPADFRQLLLAND